MSGPPDILEWWVQIDWATVFLDFDLPGSLLGKQQSVDATKLVPQQLSVPHRRPSLHSMVGFIYYLYSCLEFKFKKAGKYYFGTR